MSISWVSARFNVNTEGQITTKRCLTFVLYLSIVDLNPYISKRVRMQVDFKTNLGENLALHTFLKNRQTCFSFQNQRHMSVVVGIVVFHHRFLI